MEKSVLAQKLCQKWLAQQLTFGWRIESLPKLEEIWWNYHDWQTGEFKSSS